MLLAPEIVHDLSNSPPLGIDRVGSDWIPQVEFAIDHVGRVAVIAARNADADHVFGFEQRFEIQDTSWAGQLELTCENTETLGSPAYKELAKDLTLHVAAAAPEYLTRDEVPAETIEEEKDIARKQLEGKPENIIDNILTGKINKFFSQICFVEQGFVKDDKVSITDFVAEKSKELGDTVTIKRYVRYQLGA